MVLGGELYVYVKLVADIVSDDLILKSGNKLTGAENKVAALSLAAFKRLVADKAFVVDIYCVAVLSGAILNVDHSRVALAYSVDLGFNFVVGDFLNGLFELDALVVLDLNIGFYINLRYENNAACVVNGLYIKLGTADSVNAGLFQSVGVSVGDKIVDRVFVKYALAVHLFDDGAGSLAASEAGNCNVLRLLFIDLGDSVF